MRMIRKIGNSLIMLFLILFRHIDFPTKPRLIKIGNPNKDSLVILSGNYFYTVNRLCSILKGFDCFLLVARSSGSNVWCAAGMGEFTEHDIIDIVNFTGIKELAKSRTIIMPPAAAVGINVKRVKEDTGFSIQWAPYHYTHLPNYLRNDCKKESYMYKMPFPIRDRIEMALGTATMMSLFPAFICVFWMRIFFLQTICMIYVVTLSNFILYPYLPKERFFLRTFLSTVFYMGVLAGIGIWVEWSLGYWVLSEVTVLLISFLSSADMCGSTVVVKTTIAHWLKTGNYESLFQPIINGALCTGCGKCIDVCPKGVFQRSSQDRKVNAVTPTDCFECLACIKQCDRSAIYNLHPGIYKKDIRSIPDLEYLMARNLPDDPNKVIK